MAMLRSDNASSLVLDNLCDQTGGDNATVACFYFDSLPEPNSPPSSGWVAC